MSKSFRYIIQETSKELSIKMRINEALARRLIAAQFPQWRDLSIRSVAIGGWDNRTFHLGDNMLIRMPSAEEYAANVVKEQKWLPILAPHLPLPIPEPLAMGKPGEGYPWEWSVYRWINGDTAAAAHIVNLCDFATSLAQFLIALQRIDTSNGPVPGVHNFYRGGALATYDAATRQAITVLRDKINFGLATEAWEAALTTTWNRLPVWVHGDISAGNLLVQNGQLSAVIDFGGLVVGDPACDLTIAWTMFRNESREIFKSILSLDADTWARGRAWTLWKALIVAAGFTNPNNVETNQSWLIIDEVLADHRKNLL